MKHMKKSMFISTVMMVVLLIVALSTATFAWFSANDTVSATQTTMTAATSTDANIQIAWRTTDEFGQTISFKTADGLQPAMPLMRPTDRTRNIPAQYIATGETYASGVPFVYANATDAPTVPYIDVVDFDPLNTVTSVNATADNYPGLEGTPEILGRIYRTQFQREEFYLMTQSTVSTGTIPFTDPVGPYLTIVDDATTPKDNQITVSDAEASYDLYASGADYDAGESTTAAVGYRIYHIAAIADIHMAVGLGAPAPTGWIAGGVNASGPTELDGVDYHVVVTVSGVIDRKVGDQYYINLPQVNTEFNVQPAQAGDRIYCVRAEDDIDKTEYGDFVTSNFFTSTIDQNNRFRDTIGAATPVTLSELDGDATSFYIKNNNAVGSPAAKVDVTADFTGDAAMADLRIAIFVKNSTDEEPYYVGTLAPSESPTYFGTIAFGAISTAPNFGAYNANGSNILNFVQIDPQQVAQVYMVAWYDGIGLNTQESGQATNFTLSFKAQ